MKTLLLTGVSGQVGHALQQQLAASQLHDYQIVACDRHQLDLSQPDHIRQVVRDIAPQLIINPAAYTAVDKAESETVLAYAINATAPQILAEEAGRLGAAMIHFSTDYVYAGDKQGVYEENDATAPVSVYGASKLAGEQAILQAGIPHLILRTSWVYGSYGKNFLKTILRLAQEREVLRIVADQVGAPTTDQSIAHAVTQLLQRWQTQEAGQSGIYHLVNRVETSWHGFASEIITQYQTLQIERAWPVLQLKQLQPITTADYPTPARRPANSRLSTSKLEERFGVEMPAWQQALAAVMPGLSFTTT